MQPLHQSTSNLQHQQMNQMAIMELSFNRTNSLKHKFDNQCCVISYSSKDFLDFLDFLNNFGGSLPEFGKHCRSPEATLTEDKCSQEKKKQEPPKESISELVSSKREIFLVQLGLDMMRAEILKLSEKARHRDAALHKAEQLLEEDAKRFEAFLKENGEKLQEAVAKAEAETKLKQEQVPPPGG